MNENQLDYDPFKGSFGSLENLVDKISDVMECPVTIEDANHRLLAYSSHDDRTDSARIATIMGRRVPENVINSLWKDGVIPTLNKSEDPIRISKITGVGLGNRVAIAIRTKTEILGYIWVLEIDNKLSEKELLLLKKAAQSAKNQLLQLKVRKKKKEEGHKEFFWQLLTGDLKSHEEIIEKLERLNIRPPTPIAVIVFQFDHEITDKIESDISYMIKTTQQVQVTFHVIDRNDFILLCSPLPVHKGKLCAKEYIDEFISQMNKRFKIDQIKGACGNCYDNYEKIEASYQQALTLLRLKHKFPDDVGHTHTYQELGIYRYLDVLLQKNQEDYYENTALEKLKNYDKIHKTHLLESLEVFLNYDSNVNEASKQLHVHTNTLNYRLKRISEISGIDLKSPNQKIALYLDLKLTKLKKRPYL
ncbi:helix-turn-helix domain-containing protein [Bacillus shivajii]|uniref:PucR family transcriptional regulator n=1 Tax=Bacillus shivajii TaxID=1983719 RepID=UPI001CFAC663|nr:helix-turn-helix domain-containing protein [Bacillus shivajii]UCZ51526.1 helix-turn-helix domain-containing protein [Bacillus shivajii]